MLKLHTYFRSSAAFRVRIALHYKALPFESIPVHLLRDGGEQHSAAFAERNPARLIPVLEDGALALTQSLAIIDSTLQPAAAATSGAAMQVTIDNFSFTPGTLTVEKGTDVFWTNKGDISHTVVDSQGRFKSKVLDMGPVEAKSKAGLGSVKRRRIPFASLSIADA